MDDQGGYNQEKHKMSMVSSSRYCYSDISTGNPNNIQSHMEFDSNPDQMYNLTPGMEMIGGFPIPPHQSTTPWHDDQDQDHHHGNTRSLPFDNSSLRCVFPSEGNERPSQGLSLSLSSTNPSTIGLQSFEMRQQQNSDLDIIRFAPSSSRSDHGFFDKSVIGDGYLGKTANLHLQGQFVQIRNSKYLGPAQELLSEFCNLGTSNQTDPKMKIRKPHHKPNSTTTTSSTPWQQQDHHHEINTATTSSSSKNKSLYYNLEFLELQKRKSKLLSMLEEVDRRYMHYCDQMKVVVASFEALAGHGAARPYSALASKAMSRHFRCLRDGITGQIQDTKKAMGEKDVTPGASHGETPRLRLLDQTLRQQRAIQQMSLMETHPWRPQRGLPERSVSVLRAWLFEHFLHPYPSDVDKHILARQTGLSRSQVSNWFINARVRLWKPMVEEMYLEETKEEDNNNMGLGASSSDDINARTNQNSLTLPEDQKPTPDQLVRINSECLSSIINNREKNDTNIHMISKTSQNLHPRHHHQAPQQMSFCRAGDPFGAIELDFSSYNHQRENTISFHNDQNAHQNFGGGGNGGGVSLTLGLQQHGGNGESLAFSPTSQSSLFYHRDHIEDCQPVQYSLLDGEGQNLPYRNLMGAQLLHDLAG